MLPAKHEKVGIVGGSRDGAKVAVVDPSQCALVLVVQEVDGEWVTDLQSQVGPANVYRILAGVAKELRRKHPDAFPKAGA